MAKYKLRIGDTEVELEGETRDEAIKKAGLNPKLWQRNTGANMDVKKASSGDEQKPAVVSTPKKKPTNKTRAGGKVVAHRRKPNITIEDIGRWYTDGTDVWKLDDFIPEPQVSMSKVASSENDPQVHEIKKGNLSEFIDFRRLIPEPEPRKRTKKE